MKNVSKLQKIISLSFVGGFICCLLSLPIAFASAEAARFLFFGGGSIALVSLVYTMIKESYNEDLN